VPSERLTDFPLFPLPIVLLPTEAVPLHIFEDRYKTMIGICIEAQTEFGVAWMSDDGLKDVGCCASVVDVLETMEDGSMNILVRGTTPFRLIERSEQHLYPAGTIDPLDDRDEQVADEVIGEARGNYADLLEKATDQRPEPAALDQLGSYEMAATIEIGLPVKQGLLELRSEQARLRLLARLFKDGLGRLEVARQIGEHAQTNGKVKFDSGASEA